MFRIALSRRAGLLAALALLLSATHAYSAPRTIKDVAGRNVTIDAPAQRVVVTFYYEEFTAIAGKEGWDRVVGYSKAPWAGWRNSIWQRYVAAVPRIAEVADVGHLDDGSFSAEKVIALKPQVLIISESGYKALGPTAGQIEAAGISIVAVDYNAQTVANHVASTRAIGQVMGTEARAEELAQLYEREVADIQRRIAAAGPAKRKVYLELGMGGPGEISNTYTTTMWGKILDQLGADNIAKGKIPGALGPLNAEAVLAANPDVIFIAGSSWPNAPQSLNMGYGVERADTRATLARYLDRPGWRTLAAVRNGQVFAIQHGLARALFDFTAMQFIAKRLYPAAFADVDPEANLRLYHERYLPIAYGGVWMLDPAP